MELHGIPRGERPLLSYHDHNGPAQRPRLLGLLAEGRSLAYASDAGTPLVADPGFRLAQAAIGAGHAVHAVPGPSSALAALSVAGLPTDRFLFAGFPPAQAGARARWLEEVLPIPASLVILESGKRVGALLGALAQAGEGARGAALCRELTKRHEEIRRGTVADLAATAGEAETRGEMVLVLGPPVTREPDKADVAKALGEALKDRPLKEAAADVAAKLGVRKRDVYQMGLEMKEKGDG
jgi:16S rRNA (cytidine1402-2'-O)-methyltransferase